MLYNQQVLTCEIRKTVNVKSMLMSIGTVLHLLEQPGHLTGGITQTIFA